MQAAIKRNEEKKEKVLIENKEMESFDLNDARMSRLRRKGSGGREALLSDSERESAEASEVKLPSEKEKKQNMEKEKVSQGSGLGKGRNARKRKQKEKLKSGAAAAVDQVDETKSGNCDLERGSEDIERESEDVEISKHPDLSHYNAMAMVSLLEK